MRTEMNSLKMLGILALFILIGLVRSVGAAQSTADAVADDKLKEKLRQEIIGKHVFPGEDKEYVIGQGDVLQVSVYGEGNMAATNAAVPFAGTEADARAGKESQVNGGVVVRMDGRISLLHVGDVNVLGMTLTQAADYLKKLYSTVYTNPMVTTVLIQSNSRRYSLMGEVKAPGVFNLDYPITIVQAIARGGGFTEWADHDITIVRAGDGIKTQAGEGGKATIQLDYDDLIKGQHLDKNVYINSGDLIIVH